MLLSAESLMMNKSGPNTLPSGIFYVDSDLDRHYTCKIKCTRFSHLRFVLTVIDYDYARFISSKHDHSGR